MTFFRSVKKQEGGYTFIELLIAMVVIAILAATAIPAIIDWMPNYRLKKAARTLFSNIQLARLVSVRSNAPCAVVFNAAADEYYVCTDSGDGSWTTIANNTILKRINLAELPGNIQLGAAPGITPLTGGAPGINGNTFNNAAEFNVRGLLNQASGSVYIQNDEGVTYGIEVLASGAMTMQAALPLSRGVWQ